MSKWKNVRPASKIKNILSVWLKIQLLQKKVKWHSVVNNILWQHKTGRNKPYINKYCIKRPCSWQSGSTTSRNYEYSLLKICITVYNNWKDSQEQTHINKGNSFFITLDFRASWVILFRHALRALSFSLEKKKCQLQARLTVYPKNFLFWLLDKLVTQKYAPCPLFIRCQNWPSLKALDFERKN